MTADAFWQLEQQLKQLHLGAVLDQYRLQAEEAARGNWSYETYLATLIERESDRRRSNRRWRASRRRASRCSRNWPTSTLRQLPP
jgi:hypothetical protein